MQPEVRKWLVDVQNAGDLLTGFLRSKSLADYLGDAMLRSAVERQLGIIGEALSQAAKADGSLHGSITHLRRIVNFRHVLVHA